MDPCRKCGHELGIGRFCTNCGHRVGSDGDQPRGAQDPVGPPPEPIWAPVPSVPPEEARLPEPVAGARRPGAWVPWLVGLAVLLLVATVGLYRLLGLEAEPASTEAAGAPEPAAEPTRDPRVPTGRATVRRPPEPRPRSLARSTTVVRAPAPAPPAKDFAGRPVTFAPSNLFDGRAQTAWRTRGDATGATFVFRLDRPTRITAVGLVNGYAKIATTPSGPFDWYTGHRRVLRVTWSFGEGTSLTQDLRQRRLIQTARPRGRVVTREVTLRLDQVSPPGPGRASRNYTALSEVRLIGAPAG